MCFVSHSMLPSPEQPASLNAEKTSLCAAEILPTRACAAPASISQLCRQPLLPIQQPGAAAMERQPRAASEHTITSDLCSGTKLQTSCRSRFVRSKRHWRCHCAGASAVAVLHVPGRRTGRHDCQLHHACNCRCGKRDAA